MDRSHTSYAIHLGKIAPHAKKQSTSILRATLISSPKRSVWLDYMSMLVFLLPSRLLVMMRFYHFS